MKIKSVFVTGGAGYVGSRLIPRLLNENYKVKVLDLCIYGDNIFGLHINNPNLQLIKGDLRNTDLIKENISGSDAVIHLACISNDPSFELNPNLGKSINYDAFIPLVELAKQAKVSRFIYASSSSVYGVKSELNVTEDLPLEPLTDYSKYKALCEDELLSRRTPGFNCVIIRPATVCGYSTRMRLDLTVNILTNHAINNGKIVVFGGDQKRPNIHIDDMVDVYISALKQDEKKIDGKIFNAGYHNHTVNEIAEIVRNVIDPNVKIVKSLSDDNRSYHISSEKIKREWGFEPKRSIADAVKNIKRAFDLNLIHNSMENPRYYNIKQMQGVELV